MTTKDLVKILHRWHISPDGELYCPQCWGGYLAQFDAEMIALVKQDSRNGNLAWARNAPFCEMCGLDAHE